MLYAKSSVLDKCAYLYIHVHVYMVCIFTAIFSAIHDLRVLEIHFSSSFVYIDTQDFLRENGEVGQVLGNKRKAVSLG
jgi:hypothetical protein